MGLRCRRCSEAAEQAALRPALDEARAAQAAWRKLAAGHRAREQRRIVTCPRHSEWDTHCLWRVMRNPFGTTREGDGD